MIESDHGDHAHVPPDAETHWGWGKRLLVGLLLLAFVAAMVHLGFAMYAKGKLRQAVAQLRAQGEPILPADFAPPNPDAADNGGIDLDAASAAIAAYRDADKTMFEMDPAPPLRPEERQAIDAALKANAAALAQLDRGLAKPRRDWRLDLASPVIGKVMLPSLNGPRATAQLLAAAAVLDHDNGDDAAALRRLDRVIAISHYTSKHPSLVGHLVGIGCAALASNRVMDLAPELRVGAQPGDVTPAELRKFIDQLLDDSSARAGLKLAFRGERMAQLDTLNAIDAGLPVNVGTVRLPAPTNLAARYALRPVLYTNATFTVHYMTKLLAAVDAPDAAAARATLPPLAPRGNPLRIFSDMLIPSLDRAIETHFREVADRRLAATALAIRWYALEHDGKFPEKLDDLVPKYLPAVPTDPLVGGTHRVGYNAGPATQPYLWHAGENGVDDGGKDAFSRPASQKPQRGDEWRTLDRIVHLTPQPRPAPEPQGEP